MKGNNEAALQEPAEMLLSAASLFFPSWSLACQPNPTALLLCAAPGHSCKLSPPANVTSPENHTHRPRVLQGLHHLCSWAIVLVCFPISEILGRLLPSRTIFPSIPANQLRVPCTAAHRHSPPASTGSEIAGQGSENHTQTALCEVPNHAVPPPWASITCSQ